MLLLQRLSENFSWQKDDNHARKAALDRDRDARAFFSRLSQKLAMSSAEELPPTCLLQNCSKASLRALWNRELLLKQSVTYCAGSAPSQQNGHVNACKYV